jgi:hypothetical protein
MIAAGRLRPARSPGLDRWSPLPLIEYGPTLSEVWLEMRQQERT